MDPLLKWAGSKRRSKDLIVPAIRECLKDSSVYIEPFLGGGSIYFALEHNNVILNDLCKPLISFYSAVRKNPKSFFEAVCNILTRPHSPDTYYNIREGWDYDGEGSEFAAHFWYLNKTSYNGLFRLNRDLKYNVPWGKRANPPKQPSYDLIYKISKLLKKAKLCHVGFETILEMADEHSVIYCDPPYWNTYSGYTGRGFDDDMHLLLARSLFNANIKGASVFTSNIDCENVRSHYKWAEISIVPLRHQISCKNDTRMVVNEVFISRKSDQLKQMDLPLEFDARNEAIEI